MPGNMGVIGILKYSGAMSVYINDSNHRASEFRFPRNGQTGWPSNLRLGCMMLQRLFYRPAMHKRLQWLDRKTYKCHNESAPQMRSASHREMHMRVVSWRRQACRLRVLYLNGKCLSALQLLDKGRRRLWLVLSVASCFDFVRWTRRVLCNPWYGVESTKYMARKGSLLERRANAHLARLVVAWQGIGRAKFSYFPIRETFSLLRATVDVHSNSV